MAPVESYLSSLLKRTPSTVSDLSPKAVLLAARTKDLAARSVDSGAGVTPPTSIPNKAVFALFGLIGVGFVLTGLWFFFWAKNGGFYFRENDWDDYKSTVLRRKGPNGTTLSGASASTDLGGGSIVHGEKNSRSGRGKKNKKRYKDFDEEESRTMESSLGGSTLGSEMSELKKPKKEKKAKKEKKKDKHEGSDLMSEIDLHEEELDPAVVDAVRAYRHEKPARVGGLNKQPDGMVSTSEGGNSSFWAKSAGSDRQIEEDHVKAEARKLQEKGRAAQRRDFSFQAGDDSTVVSDERSLRREDRERRRASRSPTKKVPGSYYEESLLGSDISGDIGTKSYHHPIPGLSSTAGSSDYAEERRKKRNGAGYRRGRTEED
ncbi:hypothetical protein NA56DRAFT_680779 [Hyaloscypha hepaticicola]|uniref:Endosomal spry domain-containing protein n=1 Tax=Hyaloscypha hepaticicola TaxID=2082293 RepID=A0A2J6PW89_9HELO|nr:hypothetical protein NA56DRAFT_680779 [Hyaloscypha hepaticicola]